MKINLRIYAVKGGCPIRHYYSETANSFVADNEVRHTASELRELAHSLQSLDGETRVILEHTGKYYMPVTQALCDAGIFVSAVNPLLIKEYGNNSIRRVKTDKADALKIARYGLDNWAELREHTPMETNREQLRTCIHKRIVVEIGHGRNNEKPVSQRFNR